MSKIVTLSIAAAVVAASLAGGAASAVAGGSYYKGAWPERINAGHDAARAQKIDRNKTASVGGTVAPVSPKRTPPRRGDYYQGALRP